jgi:hypothetical protein
MSWTVAGAERAGLGGIHVEHTDDLAPVTQRHDDHRAQGLGPARRLVDAGIELRVLAIRRLAGTQADPREAGILRGADHLAAVGSRAGAIPVDDVVILEDPGAGRARAEQPSRPVEDACHDPDPYERAGGIQEGISIVAGQPRGQRSPA